MDEEPSYNEAGRARIRSALQDYMQQHRIGVPRLQTLIIEHDEPRHRQIPLSTLQRFIAGTHRTQTEYVRLCEQFAKAHCDYDDARQVTRLGESLGVFYSDAGESLHAPSNPEDQVFRGYVQPQTDGEQRTKLSFTPTEDERYWLAFETVRLDGDRRRSFEGVAVWTRQHCTITMRDALTLMPRSICLSMTVGTSSRAPLFGGHGTEVVLNESMPTSYVRSFSARYNYEVLSEGLW